MSAPPDRSRTPPPSEVLGGSYSAEQRRQPFSAVRAVDPPTGSSLNASFASSRHGPSRHAPSTANLRRGTRLHRGGDGPLDPPADAAPTLLSLSGSAATHPTTATSHAAGALLVTSSLGDTDGSRFHGQCASLATHPFSDPSGLAPNPPVQLVPEGFGWVVMASGSVYIGEWHWGRAHGRGALMMTAPCGAIADGHWNHGEFTGEGTVYVGCDREGGGDGGNAAASAGWMAQTGRWAAGKPVAVEETAGGCAAARRAALIALATALLLTPPAVAQRRPHRKLPELMPPRSAPGSIDLPTVSFTPSTTLSPRAAAARLPGETATEAGAVTAIFAHLAAWSAAAESSTGKSGTGAMPLTVTPVRVAAISTSPSGRPAGGAVVCAPLSNAPMPSESGPIPTQTAAAAAPPPDKQPVVSPAMLNALLFASAGPAYGSDFVPWRFVKFTAMYLFPFLSLPHFPCPLRISVLDLEREYVVSGAALRTEFERPQWSLYVAVIGCTCAVLTAAFAYARFSELGTSIDFVQSGRSLTIYDVAAPFVSLGFFAVLKGASFAFVRFPHTLERLDRQHFPRFATFSASCIDSQAAVCVTTWNEDGTGAVRNPHYQYRWLLLSVASAFLISIAAPIVRTDNSKPFFVSTQIMPTDYIGLAAVFSFLSVFFNMSGTLYHLMSCFDYHRQALARSNVLSLCAYLGGQSIVRPTDQRAAKFHFETPLDFTDLTQGAIGWYVMRSFIVNASTNCHHAQRIASMSLLTAMMIAIELAVIAETLYSAATGLYTTRQSQITFGAPHAAAALMIAIVGHLDLVYVYLCARMEKERQRHVFLLDVARIHHMSVASAMLADNSWSGGSSGMPTTSYLAPSADGSSQGLAPVAVSGGCGPVSYVIGHTGIVPVNAAAEAGFASTTVVGNAAQHSRTAELLFQCRTMVLEHDVRYKILNVVVSGFSLWILLILHLTAAASLLVTAFTSRTYN